MRGAGVFDGRWRGTLDDPVFEGRFTGDDVSYLGVRWGHAEWVGALDAREVRPHSLVLRRPGGELWLDGRVETGDYGEDDALDARVRLTDWPAPDLVKALGWDVEVQGLVSGEAALTGRRSDAHGSAHLTSAAGRYYGVPYEDLDVQHAAARARHGGDGRARARGRRRGLFRGTVTDDGIYDGRAQLDALDVSALFPKATPSRRSGRARVGHGPSPGDAGAAAGGGRPDLAAAVPGRRGRGRAAGAHRGHGRRPPGRRRALPLAPRWTWPSAARWASPRPTKRR